jgi:hypothetical protein
VAEIVNGSVPQTDETLAPRGEVPRSDASYAGHFAAVALCRSLPEGTSPYPPLYHLHMQRRRRQIHRGQAHIPCRDARLVVRPDMAIQHKGNASVADY